MKIIFFGSSAFGLPSLKSLLGSGHSISCVVTQPDRKKGRGLHIAESEIKLFSQSAGLTVYQPEKVNAPDAADFLKKCGADLFVVIAYGQLLRQELLDIPRIMPLNVHASVLPLYRGASPINRAIINAETETGITLIKMSANMDAGPIILQKKTSISNEDTAVTLENKLSSLAAQALLETLELIGNNNYALTAQDEGKATFAPKLKKEDGLIDWNKRASDIYNLIRGCLGWPNAYTYYNGKLLKIYKAKIAGFPVQPFDLVRLRSPQAAQDRQVSRLPGQVTDISKEGITVATQEGGLTIEELQIEGKRRMKAEEFIAGHKIHKGEILNP